MQQATPKIAAVDLFCGVGGLSEGLSNAGIDIRAGIDIDSDCEFPFTHNQNAAFILKDIRDIQGSDIVELWKNDSDYTLLAGCAPCQSFSTLRKSGTGFNHDGR